MATLTEIVQSKPDLESVSGDPNYRGYWSSLSGSVLQGQVVSYLGEFWQAVELIADVTASTPGDNNDSWLKRQDAIFDYAVSQLAGGNPAIVSYIYKNRSISTIEYFIWPATGQVFSTNGATGAFSDPIDFNPSTGVDSGITGALIEFSAIKETRVEAIESDISLLEFQSSKSVSIDFASDADLTLTGEQNKYGRIELNDSGVLLTTNREVIVDTSERNFLVVNKTLQDLKVKTLGGTGFTVQSGREAKLRCDGVNVLTGVGCKHVILALGQYSSGTYSYPDGLDQSAYSMILAITSPNTTVGQSGPSGVVMDYQIDSYPSSWSTEISSKTGENVNILFASTTSFTVSRAGSNDIITSVFGHLKEGVTS